MDGLLGILGAICLVVGGLLLLMGMFGGTPFDRYQGAALIASGISLLSVSTIIRLLKEIRDALTARAKGEE
ncbi:MAG: hypothetical protein ACPGSI_13190 [Pikeienuella sp.]